MIVRSLHTSCDTNNGIKKSSCILKRKKCEKFRFCVQNATEKCITYDDYCFTYVLGDFREYYPSNCIFTSFNAVLITFICYLNTQCYNNTHSAISFFRFAFFLWENQIHTKSEINFNTNSNDEQIRNKNSSEQN